MRPSIVTVAGMMHRKGIAELIEAFAKLPADGSQTHLYLVGSGSEQASFQELASRSGAADRIHFEGFQADPRPTICNRRICLCLHPEEKSFALAILGSPRGRVATILATAVDGIPEALEHGRCGVLVPPQDSTALVAAEMIRILRDRPLQESLRREAKIGLDRFTVNRMVDEVSDIYGEIFDGSRVAGSRAAQSVSA